MSTVPQLPGLVNELMQLLVAHREAFGQQRVFERVVALVMAELVVWARHTVTQLLWALGVQNEDWSGWYRLFSRGRFVEEAVNRVLLRETLREVEPDELYVVGVDGVQVWRDSQKMEGTSWLKCPRTPAWRPGIHRAQRFLNGSWLVPAEAGYSRAVILRLLPAFVEKAQRRCHEAVKEWQAGLSFVRWVRAQLDEAGRTAQMILLLGDGGFENTGLWTGLPDKVVLLVRTAKNRCLYHLPPAYAGRGRRRIYGTRAAAPQDWLKARQGWQTLSLTVRARQRRMVYRVEGPFIRRGAPQQPLFLLVVRGQAWKKHGNRRGQRNPCFYLVNAVLRDGQWHLPLPIETLLFWAWQRWELEVAHREVKSGFGLGDKQCWNPLAAVTSVQWSAWLYSLLLLAAYRAWGLTHHPRATAAWWPGSPRWSFNHLWRALHLDCLLTPDFLPLLSLFPTNLAKNRPLAAMLYDAMLAAAPA
jgi:hypothetical protein